MKNQIVLPTVVLLSSALFSFDAFSEAANKGQIETITVLGSSAVSDATLGGVDVKALPINIHVIGSDEIERIRFVDPDEVLDRIPGETQVRNLRIPNGSKGYTIPMVDGMPLENPYEGATGRLDRVNSSDIARIEVLKGPASALYGNNAFGGVVNVVTKTPPESLEGKINAEFGNFNRSRFGVNVGNTVSDVGFFLDTNMRRLDGLRDESVNDRDQLSAKITYSFNDNTSILTRIEHIDETLVTRGDLTADELREDETQAGTLRSSSNMLQNTAAVKLTHQLANGHVEASVVNRLKKSIGLSKYSGPKDARDRGIASKLTYQHNFEYVTLTVGVDNYNSDESVLAFGKKDIDMAGSFKTQFNRLDNTATFAQGHYQFTKKLSIDAGLRHEKIELGSILFDKAMLLSEDNNANFSDLSPKFGLSYQINDDNRLWIGVSKGFYAPRISDIYSTDPDASNLSLKPEQATNIEIGLRGKMGDVSFDTSVYQNVISNYLVDQEFIRADDSEYIRVTNAGQVTIRGIESILEYAPDSDWRAAITHTYNDNSYDSFVQSVPGAKDDLSGKVLRRSPKHHFNARVAILPIDGLIIELEGDFYSSYYADDNNSDEALFTRDERLNLRISYDAGDINYYLNALNMTDTLEDRATYSRGKMKFRTADGRTIYAGISYNF